MFTYYTGTSQSRAASNDLRKCLGWDGKSGEGNREVGEKQHQNGPVCAAGSGDYVGGLALTRGVDRWDDLPGVLLSDSRVLGPSALSMR